MEKLVRERSIFGRAKLSSQHWATHLAPIHRLNAHQGCVNTLDYSPDASLLLSGRCLHFSISYMFRFIPLSHYHRHFFNNSTLIPFLIAFTLYFISSSSSLRPFLVVNGTTETAATIKRWLCGTLKLNIPQNFPCWYVTLYFLIHVLGPDSAPGKHLLRKVSADRPVHFCILRCARKNSCII